MNVIANKNIFFYSCFAFLPSFYTTFVYLHSSVFPASIEFYIRLYIVFCTILIENTIETESIIFIHYVFNGIDVAFIHFSLDFFLVLNLKMCAYVLKNIFKSMECLHLRVSNGCAYNVF